MPAGNEAGGISISEAAAVTGLSAHTLRYYERADLMLASVARTGSMHRRYTGHDLEWMALLTRLRRTGMPIRTLRRYRDLVRSPGSERERIELLEAHRERVRARLDETAEHLAAIEDKIAGYRAMVGPAS
jgi:DNA-binding transcriptional MerR regulator